MARRMTIGTIWTPRRRARAAALGSVRWLLRISLGLAILAGVIIYFCYANFLHG